MDMDFKRLIDLYGQPGARDEFQNVCYTMLQRKFNENVHKMRENPGDEGIDIYVGDFSQPIDVYQCKFLLNDLKYQQINNSFEKAITNTNYKIKSWTLMIPKDMDIKERTKWTSWKKERETKYNIKINLFDQSLIIDNLKKHNIYDEVFKITERILLQQIHQKIESAMPAHKKHISFILQKTSNYLSLRITVFKDLYFNSYDVKSFFRQNQISSFHEMFQNADTKSKFLFDEIDNLIKKIEEDDYQLAYMCRQFIYMEKIYIDQIEDDLHYSDEYLLNLKSYVFQVSLQKIIWSLEQEAHSIRQYLSDTETPNSEVNAISEFDWRDTIITYKDRSDILKLLAIHVISLNHKFSNESFEIFYNKADKLALNFGLFLDSSIIRSSKTPYPTSISELIQYVKYNHTKINEVGEFVFHTHSCNVICLEELDTKAIDKLHKLKNAGNIKYHYFINENRVDKFKAKLPSDKEEFVKIMTLNDYSNLIQTHQEQIETLLKYPSEQLSDKLLSGVMYDGSLFTSNDNGFVIRKNKSLQ
ncbi:hypothetical protein [Cohnella herbarum]|uniref:Uncharacterized protein n=1 Tax=Cohnella herbarum TaxID=2728023 RepID=A0A7Z2VF54_9BACL|nr:hypothetical protein [Cohnella herbarum]QJD82061.1 hypothetical protein HH215_01950 [Cohnella herbarum]